MPKQSDIDFKAFIKQIGNLYDARAKTQEVIMKAHIDASIKASEGRLKAQLASKEDIKDMAKKQDIVELKRDIARLDKKIDETKDLRNRLEDVEEELMSIRSKN